MKNRNIIVMTAIALSAAAVRGAGTEVEAVKPYVFPANRPAAPSSMTYMPDGKTYAVLAEDGRSVRCYDIRTGAETEPLIDLARTREVKLDAIEGFEVSPDGSQVMVWTDSEPIYRRSVKAKYYTYEVRSRLLRPLSAEHKYQRSPIFSPDNRMVAFVDPADNNIYIKKLDYQSEVPVTGDGAPGRVINGVPDWVYEEEFQTTCSMAWAPDALTLCWVRYDESDVPSYDMTLYDGACEPRPEYALYPHTWSYKYPVAGRPNSRVSLHSYDVDNRKVKDIPLPDSKIEYIPRIDYAPTGILLASTLNRDQNRFEIYSVNPKSTVVKSVYTEESKTWISPLTYENLTLLPDGFVVNSWKDGWNRLYQYSYVGALTRQLTSGDYDVTEYYGCDAQGNHYYCVAAPTPMDRGVRRLDRKGREEKLSPETGNASASFSPDMQYMTLRYDSPAQAPVYKLCTAAGKELRVLEDNAAYAARYAGRLPEKEFFTMTSAGNTLNGYVIKPEGFDPSKKYPCIMYQYSGPGSQEVLHRWEVDWQQAFARRGYVVVCVDGRGTGGRGRAFCDVVYRCLGRYETEDQLGAARHAASLPYVDSARIGIFGWSYGGYESLMCATANGSPYAAAVAVAPVTDWRLYDTVYAERYMLTPAQNEDGYNQSAPLARAGQLQCPLLIMYGTSDDNVHPANSLEFVSRLIHEGLMCDMLLFPNMNHSIRGCDTRTMVYAKMLDWMDKNLR